MSQTFLEDIPEFLEIQRNSFLRILDKGLIQSLEKINPILPSSETSPGLLFYPKNYVLVLPENTITEAFLQGKTYGCKIYVPAILYETKKQSFFPETTKDENVTFLNNKISKNSKHLAVNTSKAFTNYEEGFFENTRLYFADAAGMSKKQWDFQKNHSFSSEVLSWAKTRWVGPTDGVGRALWVGGEGLTGGPYGWGGVYGPYGCGGGGGGWALQALPQPPLQPSSSVGAHKPNPTLPIQSEGPTDLNVPVFAPKAWKHSWLADEVYKGFRFFKNRADKEQKLKDLWLNPKGFLTPAFVLNRQDLIQKSYFLAPKLLKSSRDRVLQSLRFPKEIMGPKRRSLLPSPKGLKEFSLDELARASSQNLRVVHKKRQVRRGNFVGGVKSNVLEVLMRWEGVGETLGPTSQKPLGPTTALLSMDSQGLSDVVWLSTQHQGRKGSLELKSQLFYWPLSSKKSKERLWKPLKWKEQNVGSPRRVIASKFLPVVGWPVGCAKLLGLGLVGPMGPTPSIGPTTAKKPTPSYGPINPHPQYIARDLIIDKGFFGSSKKLFIHNLKGWKEHIYVLNKFKRDEKRNIVQTKKISSKVKLLPTGIKQRDDSKGPSLKAKRQKRGAGNLTTLHSKTMRPKRINFIPIHSVIQKMGIGGLKQLLYNSKELSSQDWYKKVHEKERASLQETFYAQKDANPGLLDPLNLDVNIQKKNLSFTTVSGQSQINSEFSKKSSILHLSEQDSKNVNYKGLGFDPSTVCPLSRKEWVCIGVLPLMTPRGHFIINGSHRIIISQMSRAPGIYYQTGEKALATIVPSKGAWLRMSVKVNDNGEIKIWIRITPQRKIPYKIFIETYKYLENRKAYLDPRDQNLFTKVERSNLRSNISHKDPKSFLYYPQSKFLNLTYKNVNSKIKHFDKHYAVGVISGQINRTLLNSFSYTLGNLGRKRLNERLGINEKTGYITSKDIEIIKDNLLKKRGQNTSTGFCDDIDHLENRRVRTCGELLQAEIEVGMTRLKKAVGKQLDEFSSLNVQENTRDKLKSQFRPEILNKPLSPQFVGKERFLANSTEDPVLRDPQLHHLESKPSANLVGLAPTNQPNPRGLGFQWPQKVGIVLANHGDFRSSPLKNIRSVWSKPGLVSRNLQQITPKAVKVLQDPHGVGPRDRSEPIGCVGGSHKPINQPYSPTTQKWFNKANISPSKLISTKAFAGALREFFGSNPLSQYMDQTNPLAEITHKRRLSSLGPGGVDRASAGIAIRGIHPSHYGRICPIETPEGKNAGLVNSMTMLARINPEGFLETPYIAVKGGSVMSQKNSLFPEWHFVPTKKESRMALKIVTSDVKIAESHFLPPVSLPTRDGAERSFGRQKRDIIDFCGVSPMQNISVATSLIPFLEHDDATRALMGSNMQRQAVPLLKAQGPLVRTGLEGKVVGESGHALQAGSSGLISIATRTVISIDTFSRTQDFFNFPILICINKVKKLPFWTLRDRGYQNFYGNKVLGQKKFESVKGEFTRNQRSGWRQYLNPTQGKTLGGFASKSPFGLGSSRLTTKHARLTTVTSKKIVEFINQIFCTNNKQKKLYGNPSILYLKSLLDKKIWRQTTKIERKRKTQSLQHYTRSNQATTCVQRPAVTEGHWVQKGDLVGDCSASKNGVLALGQNIVVAYLPMEGFNFEDAIVVSDRLVHEELYTSLHIQRVEFDMDAIVKKNIPQKIKVKKQKSAYKTIQQDWITWHNPHLLKHEKETLGPLGIIKVGSWVGPGDILVSKVFPVERKIAPSRHLLLAVFQEKKTKTLDTDDTSLRVPKGIHGRVINVKIVGTGKIIPSLLACKAVQTKAYGTPLFNPAKTSESEGLKLYPFPKDIILNSLKPKALIFSKKYSTKSIVATGSPSIMTRDKEQLPLHPFSRPKEEKEKGFDTVPNATYDLSNSRTLTHGQKISQRIWRSYNFRFSRKLKSLVRQEEIWGIWPQTVLHFFGTSGFQPIKLYQKPAALEIFTSSKSNSFSSYLKKVYSVKANNYNFSNKMFGCGVLHMSKNQSLLSLGNKNVLYTSKTKFSDYTISGAGFWYWCAQQVRMSRVGLWVGGLRLHIPRMSRLKPPTHPHTQGHILWMSRVYGPHRMSWVVGGALPPQHIHRAHKPHPILWAHPTHPQYSISPPATKHHIFRANTVFPRALGLKPAARGGLEALSYSSVGKSYGPAHKPNPTQPIQPINQPLTNRQKIIGFQPLHSITSWGDGFAKKKQTQGFQKSLYTEQTTQKTQSIPFFEPFYEAKIKKFESSIEDKTFQTRVQTLSEKAKARAMAFKRAGLKSRVCFTNYVCYLTEVAKKSTIEKVNTETLLSDSSIKNSKDFLGGANLSKKPVIYYPRETLSLQEKKEVKLNLSLKTRILKKAKIDQEYQIIQVRIYIAERKKLQVGDKMSGRHGNKGIVSTILPREDMPYLPDGTSVDMVLNPLGIPSRMNVGQVFECLLGLASSVCGENIGHTPFDEMYGPEASRSLVYLFLYVARLRARGDWLFQPKFPGKTILFDGRTGSPFEQWVTVGRAYMLKLIHMVDEKIHARSIGPRSLVTQQPVKGRARGGGQRLGEMEVWALEGFGAAYTLQEILTLKSDDIRGREEVENSIIFATTASSHIPETFRMMLFELRCLCLNVELNQNS